MTALGKERREIVVFSTFRGARRKLLQEIDLESSLNSYLHGFVEGQPYPFDRKWCVTNVRRKVGTDRAMAEILTARYEPEYMI